jgi:hypothetical protein
VVTLERNQSFDLSNPLTGNEVFAIDGITYTHQGNICLQDNAKLLIRNGGTLEVQLGYHEEYAMWLLDNASLERHGGNHGHKCRTGRSDH